MMALLFSSLLISSYHAEWPNPYLGAETNLFNEREMDAAGAKVTKRRSLLNIGFPFRLLDKAESNDLAPTWIITPEFSWCPTVFAFNLMGGIESGWPIGYRTRLSAFIWNIQTGFHYNLMTNKDVLNEYGSVMNTDDSTSVAAVLQGAIGPRFEFTDRYSMRAMFNYRFLFGKIAYHTFRSDFSKYAGMMIGVNFQFVWKQQ